ncbi:MAG TPA: hypothetical protein VF806_02460 [Anaerolineaceae bacterium]
MSEYYLAEVAPVVRRVRIPLVRDQWMLLMLAVNEILLGVETYLAHSISSTIIPGEWIPILFGPIAGGFLLVAGLIAFRRRTTANLLGSIVFLASIVVGLLGSYFHLRRAILLGAPVGQQVSVPLLVYAPPVLGPITFALVGILGLSAAWQESPVGSGRLILPGRAHLQMPLSKTRAYFLLIGLGALITVISSALDHSRTGFINPWVWIPIVVGVFSTTAIILLGILSTPTRADLTIYAVAMILMVLTGMLGSTLHILRDVTSLGVVVGERLIHGAPVMAPMLFANMGAFGIIILLDPGE